MEITKCFRIPIYMLFMKVKEHVCFAVKEYGSDFWEKKRNNVEEVVYKS